MKQINDDVDEWNCLGLPQIETLLVAFLKSRAGSKAIVFEGKQLNFSEDFLKRAHAFMKLKNPEAMKKAEDYVENHKGSI